MNTQRVFNVPHTNKRMLCISGSDLRVLKMKNFEQKSSVDKVDPKFPWIVRLDGRRFSKLTKLFQKPFDTRGNINILIYYLNSIVHRAMIQTSLLLLDAVQPTVIYTFSDEITLLFPVTVQSFKAGEVYYYYNII